MCKQLVSSISILHTLGLKRNSFSTSVPWICVPSKLRIANCSGLRVFCTRCLVCVKDIIGGRRLLRGMNLFPEQGDCIKVRFSVLQDVEALICIYFDTTECEVKFEHLDESFSIDDIAIRMKCNPKLIWSKCARHSCSDSVCLKSKIYPYCTTKKTYCQSLRNGEFNLLTHHSLNC